MIDNKSVQLKPSVTRHAFTALVVNCMIGAGVFGLPGKVYSLSGSHMLLVLAISGLVALLIAFCLAELGSRFPETGGVYIYVERSFGGVAGYATAWLTWLSTVLAAASILNLAVDYALPLLGIADTPAATVGLASLTASLVTWSGLRGVGEAAWVSTLLTLAKILLLVAVAGLGFLMPATATDAPSTNLDLNASVLLCLYAFVGFERATTISGEVINPARTVPLALISGVVIVGAIYASVFAACMLAVPNLAGDPQPLATIAAATLGPHGAYIIAGGAFLALLGTSVTQFITAPRILVALAQEGRAPSALARISAGRHSPDVAIITTAIVILCATVSADFVSSLSAAVSARALVYLLCCASLIKLRHTRNTPAARFSLPAGTCIALLGGACCAAILVVNASAELPRLIILLLAGGLVWCLGRITGEKPRAA